MGKLRLSTLLFLQTGLMCMIPVYVILRQQGLRSDLWLLVILAGGTLQSYLEQKKIEKLDECARAILCRIDSECLMFAAGLAVVAAELLVTGSVPPDAIGVGLSVGIAVLFLVRATLFAWRDRKGLV